MMHLYALYAQVPAGTHRDSAITSSALHPNGICTGKIMMQYMHCIRNICTATLLMTVVKFYSD